MSYEDRIYMLYGGACISPSRSGIGIPVFTSYPENNLFVCSTDLHLKVKSFQLMQHFEQGVVPFSMDEMNDLKQVQVCEADLLPIIVFDNNKMRLFLGDDIVGVRREILDSFNLDNKVIVDLLSQIDSIINQLNSLKLKEDLEPHEARKRIVPRPARFWLDKVIGRLIDSDLKSQEISAADRTNVRAELLAWADEIAEYSTSPIFGYFVDIINKVDSRGIYTEDIIACVLTVRMYGTIARKDKTLDLIRMFREKYNRGPVGILEEIVGNEKHSLRNRAISAIDGYHQVVRDMIKSFKFNPNRDVDVGNILLTTFLLDRERQWPDDILKTIEDYKDYHHIKLRENIAQRADNIDLLNKLKIRRLKETKIFQNLKFEEDQKINNNSKSPLKSGSRDKVIDISVLRDKFDKEILDIRKEIDISNNSIRNCIKYIDLSNKMLFLKRKYGNFYERFMIIDLDEIGLNESFVNNLSTNYVLD
jgi:hypothetical protein